jgi:nitrate/TMAO reductase-like tetraheme cytochrome c subunit
LFCLAAHADTPFWQQIPVAVYLSLAFVAGGYVLSRHQPGAWPTALYTCAAIFAGFCGVVSLFTPAVVDSWLMFLVNGIVFASLFMILRQDVFVYLVTLSLALMAYSWVKASTSVFTQDIMFYLVIGAAFLGAFFSLPHLKRLLVKTGSLPVFGIFSLRGKLLMAIPGAGLALLVLSAYSLKLTSHPKFCSSCHNMGEYYSSWQHSSHKDVACVQCHFEPGPTAMMEGKLAGLVQVVKYVSHSYAPKPHAVISNKSCMRPGDCHADMDHSKETLLFRGQIRFRHDKHLAEHPRGKTLNCVSCHGYTGQGEHISVTKTTCLTCHFYGGKESKLVAGTASKPVTGTASKPVAGKQSDYGKLRECATCHRLPQKAVKFMGQEFSHQKFLKDKEDVQCTHCHSQVTQGDGAISTTRCRSCHQDKPMEVGDQERFHLVHVSEGHFDCLQCHDEIKHGIHPMEQQLLASGNCKSCHSGERHTLQERIYAGTAMQPSVKDMPDPMYKAGVSCGGCHTEVRPAGLGAMPFTKKFSGPKQCVDCHSRKKVNGKDVGKAKYGKMLVGWQEDTKDRIAEYQPELTKLQAELDKLDKATGSARPPAEGLAKAKKQLSSAQTSLTYIVKDGSLGAHNFPYVSQALDNVEEEIEKLQSMVSKWKKATGGSP